VIDGTGSVRWRWDSDCYELLIPGGATLDNFFGSTYRGSEIDAPIDELGHLFLDFNPGRYNGVIVLRPIANGFATFGTLPPEGDYAGRFYYAEALDQDGDGRYEVDLHNNDCEPDCAGGTVTTVRYRWNGKDYAS
jgi:hypothetical protein